MVLGTGTAQTETGLCKGGLRIVKSNVATAHPTAAELRGIVVKIKYRILGQYPK